MIDPNWCSHYRTTFGADLPFFGPVFTLGETTENRDAHGGVVYEQRCKDCGAVRRVADCEGNLEHSAWSESPFVRGGNP